MKLQEFTELLTKPLMIKMETTDIACARLAQRQKTYIWIDTRLLYGFEHSTTKCPFVNLPEKRRTMWALTAEMKNRHWLKPRLVSQVEFTEWTPDEHLRHCNFVGLRDDKEARQIVRE